MDIIFENVPLKSEEDLDCITDLEAKQEYKPAIERWHQYIKKRINQSTQRDDEKLMDGMMLAYNSILKEQFVKSKERSLLKGKLLLHIRYFYLYYKAVGDAVIDTSYFVRMEDILAYYCSLELEIVHNSSKQRENKKHNISAIKRLCKILGIYLHHRLKYIIHVLLKAKYNIRSIACQTVMRRVYWHFLMTIPSESLSNEVFCRYYLAFERYKQIAKQEEYKMLGEFVFKKFGKTEDFLKTNPITKRALSPKWVTVPDAVPLVIDWVATAIQEYFVYLKNQENERTRLISDFDINYGHNGFVNGFYNYPARPVSEALTNDSDSDVQQVPKEGVVVVEDLGDIQMTYIEAPKSITTIDLSEDPQQTTNKVTCSSSSSDVSTINDEVNTSESSMSLPSSDKEQNKCDEEVEIVEVLARCQVAETTQGESETTVPSACTTLSVVNLKPNENINNSDNTSNQVSEIPSTISPPFISNSEETEMLLDISEETNMDSVIALKNSQKTCENINLPTISLNSAAHEIENQQPASIILPYELSLATEPFQKSQQESEKLFTYKIPTSSCKGSETAEHHEESWNTNSNTSILAANQTIPLENEALTEFCVLRPISASSLVQLPNFLSQTPTSKPQHAIDDGEISTSYTGSITTDMVSKYTHNTTHGDKSISMSALSVNLPDDIFIEATLPASAISSDDNGSIPQSTRIYSDTNHFSRGDDIISHAMTALFESYSETESNDAANTSEMDIKETIVYAPSENILDSDGQTNTDKDDYSNTEVYSEGGEFLMEYSLHNSCRTALTKSSKKKSKSRKQKKKLYEKEYSSKSSRGEKNTEPQKVLYTSGVIDNYSKTEMNGDKDIDGVLSGPVSTLLIVIPQHAEETLEIDSFSSGGYNDVVTSSDKKHVQGKPSVHFNDSIETHYIPPSCNCSEDEEQNYIIHDGIKCYIGDHKIKWNTEIKFQLKKLTTVADENMSVTEKRITGNHNTKKTCIRQKIEYRTNATMKGEGSQNDVNVSTNNIPTNVYTNVINEVGTATDSYQTIEDPVYNETAIPPDIPQSDSSSPLNVEQAQLCPNSIPTIPSNMEESATGSSSYGGLHENKRSSYMQGQRIIVNGYISPPRRRGRPKKRPLEEEYITKKRRR